MCPPLDQNFFIAMQVSGKVGQIIGRRLPSQGLAPTLVNLGPATVPCESSSMSLHYYNSFSCNDYGQRPLMETDTTKNVFLFLQKFQV